MTIGNVFHAGDGNLHPNILFDPDDQDMMERVLKGGEEILKICLAAGGTLSGEHGIGLEKSEYMDLVFDEQDLSVMKKIRLAFDPEHLANPGKIFPNRSGCGETHAKNAQTPTSKKTSALATAGISAPRQESENQEGLWI